MQTYAPWSVRPTVFNPEFKKIDSLIHDMFFVYGIIGLNLKEISNIAFKTLCLANLSIKNQANSYLRKVQSTAEYLKETLILP